jgi:hypothetical protein
MRNTRASHLDATFDKEYSTRGGILRRFVFETSRKGGNRDGESNV